MGCMVEVKIHEDNFDDITELILLGLKHAKRADKNYKYHDEVIESYKDSVRDFIRNIKQTDALTGEPRDSPGRICRLNDLKEESR